MDVAKESASEQVERLAVREERRRVLAVAKEAENVREVIKDLEEKLKG